MRNNRSRDTTPELTLRRLVWHRGLRFRTHTKLPGRPDIVFPAARLVVFIDGCFWHGCAIHGVIPHTRRAFWSRKLTANIERDGATNRRLTAVGWRVLRLWEHEVRSAPAKAAERVVRAVQKGARLR